MEVKVWSECHVQKPCQLFLQCWPARYGGGSMSSPENTQQSCHPTTRYVMTANQSCSCTTSGFSSGPLFSLSVNCNQRTHIGVWKLFTCRIHFFSSSLYVLSCVFSLNHRRQLCTCECHQQKQQSGSPDTWLQQYKHSQQLKRRGDKI